MPHGGSVIRSGKTGLSLESGHTMELSLSLDSNPEFTGSVLLCYARAVSRLAKRGDFGCKTVLDVSVSDLSPYSKEELYRTLL
jgi:diaminopimelate dehydrogenase